MAAVKKEPVGKIARAAAGIHSVKNGIKSVMEMLVLLEMRCSLIEEQLTNLAKGDE